MLRVSILGASAPRMLPGEEVCGKPRDNEAEGRGRSKGPEQPHLVPKCTFTPAKRWPLCWLSLSPHYCFPFGDAAACVSGLLHLPGNPFSGEATQGMAMTLPRAGDLCFLS